MLASSGDLDAPVHDEPAGARVLTGLRTNMTDFVHGATRGAQEVDPAPGTGGSLWYRWDIPQSGLVQILPMELDQGIHWTVFNEAGDTVLAQG